VRLWQHASLRAGRGARTCSSGGQARDGTLKIERQPEGLKQKPGLGPILFR
jgi:hypothetical protein